jgi:aminoglycoside 2''-phosphotransferase
MQVSPEILVDKLTSAEFAIEHWELLGAGQNNVVILANGEWVFRYPLHADAADSLSREISVLRTIHGRLPVPTPNPEIVVDVQGLDWQVMGYPAIEGEALSRDSIAAFSAESMTKLGKVLGRFMRTLHSTPASRFSSTEQLNRDSIEHWERLSSDARKFLKPRVESSDWKRVNRKLGKSIEKISRLEFESVLRHGDFGSGNFLFDRQSQLSGVLDFGSAGFGDPAIDIAGVIATDPSGNLLDRVVSAYPAADEMIDRARIYRETFALQHALLGAKGDDEQAIEEGLHSYLDR